MKYRIVYFGSGAFGLKSLAALAADQRFDLVQIVTQSTKQGPRGPQPTPVLTWAQEHGFAPYTPLTLKSDEVRQALAAFQADCFVVIAYGLILPEAVLDLPPHGCINVHSSLLPKYRGASPIPAAILNGDSETGVTIIQMDAGIDTGPMLQSAKIAIQASDTTQSLSQKLSATAATLLPDSLNNCLSGTITPTPQPETSPTVYATKISKEDGRATWNSGVQLERKIRAFTPWPGVWTTWNATTIKILQARFETGTPTEAPGTVVSYAKQWAIVCSDGLLIPEDVQFAGKKPQPAASIPGSYPNFLGSRLG